LNIYLQYVCLQHTCHREFARSLHFPQQKEQN
jgi:hypothetical protein